MDICMYHCAPSLIKGRMAAPRLIAIVVVSLLWTAYPCMTQDEEATVLYETPVYKVSFEEGYIVKVYSYDDVLDGVENDASQVAQFVMPLDAVPGARLLASFIAEKMLCRNNTSSNDSICSQQLTSNSTIVAKNSSYDNLPENKTQTNSSTSEGGSNKYGIDESVDSLVLDVFQQEVNVDLEKEYDMQQDKTDSLFSKNELAFLEQKVQALVDKYAQEHTNEVVEKESNNSSIAMQTTTSSYTIEALFVVDFSIYSQFLTRALNNPFTAMEDVKAFYSNVVQATNTRLNTASAGTSSSFSLSMSLSGIIISETQAASPWTEDFRFGGDTVNVIIPSTQFNVFAAGLNSAFPHDLAVLFTGWKLTTGASEVQGYIAAPNLLCSLIGNIWISNSQDERTSLYLARYIGDSLGVQRDGPNGCDENALNVMSSLPTLPGSPEAASNPWAFSSCSAEALRAQVATSAFTCTTSLQNSAPFNTALYTSTPFGQRFDADEQCQDLFNPTSRFCREFYYSQNPPFSAMCYNLQCEQASGVCAQTIAHDGTSCGDRSFCQQGVCVPSLLAPFRPPNCPQLDNPRTVCTLASCANPVLAAGDCCGTCNNIIATTTPAF